eukprot:2442298-Ditylum_brightwellii.AAC.1
MVTLHAYSCEDFVLDILKSSKYGGNLNIRKYPNIKPITVLVQSGLLLKKDSFSSKGWKMHDGAIVLLPKTEGKGLMMSVLQCRYWGFGLQ